MDKVECIECGKTIKAAFAAKCPACKDGPRCVACMGKHMDAKLCKYGNAEVIDVAI